MLGLHPGGQTNHMRKIEFYLLRWGITICSHAKKSLCKEINSQISGEGDKTYMTMAKPIREKIK